jgi:hypothetical protein
VSAKNITINGLNKVEFGQGTSRAISCDTDGVKVSLGSKYASNGSNSNYYLSEFTISDISDNCLNKLFTIYFSNTNSETIGDVAAKLGPESIDHVSFVLHPNGSIENPAVFDSAQAYFPFTYRAVDYIPVATSGPSGENIKVKVSLDYHHFIPAIDVAYFAIEISEPDFEDKAIINSVDIDCGSGIYQTYMSRYLDRDFTNLIKNQIAPIPQNCKGKWIQLYILNRDGTQASINEDYLPESTIGYCNKQNFGGRKEITLYLPVQDLEPPLFGGSRNSFTTAKVNISNGNLNLYIDFFTATPLDALRGIPQINVLPATC